MHPVQAPPGGDVDQPVDVLGREELPGQVEVQPPPRERRPARHGRPAASAVNARCSATGEPAVTVQPSPSGSTTAASSSIRSSRRPPPGRRRRSGPVVPPGCSRRSRSAVSAHARCVEQRSIVVVHERVQLDVVGQERTQHVGERVIVGSRRSAPVRRFWASTARRHPPWSWQMVSSWRPGAVRTHAPRGFHRGGRRLHRVAAAPPEKNSDSSCNNTQGGKQSPAGRDLHGKMSFVQDGIGKTLPCTAMSA